MNEEDKKKILQMIPHALYILTAQAENRMVASTVTWLTQASFHPPLVMAGLKKDTMTFDLVRQSRAFVVNVVGKDQMALAQKFFKHAEHKDHKLGGETYELSPVLKLPFFPHMAGFLECRVTDLVERGDHTVVVAQVVEAVTHPVAGPLLLSSTPWQYGG
jgi:flavin reductase (DIM6/NTAB) family NADH-FMN oxidoreductase RutF